MPSEREELARLLYEVCPPGSHYIGEAPPWDDLEASWRELFRFRADRLLPYIQQRVDAAVQAEREKRVVLLREYGCHNPAVIYDPNAYCNADSSGSRREWKSGDEAFCNCGLAAAIRSGEKPTE